MSVLAKAEVNGEVPKCFKSHEQDALKLAVVSWIFKSALAKKLLANKIQ